MGKQHVCSGLCQMTFAVTKSRESSRNGGYLGEATKIPSCPIMNLINSVSSAVFLSQGIQKQ